MVRPANEPPVTLTQTESELKKLNEKTDKMLTLSARIHEELAAGSSRKK